jgi:hypothetical protein
VLSPSGRHPNLGRRLRRLASPRFGAFQWARKLVRRTRTNLTWTWQIFAKPRRKPSRWLTELVADNVDVVIVCGRPDIRPVLFGVPKRLLEKLTQTGSFQFTCIPDLEHVHFVSDRRYALAQMLTNHIADRFGPGCALASEEPATLVVAKAG